MSHDTPEQHRQRSDFVRELVQAGASREIANKFERGPIARHIVQYWHSTDQMPGDIKGCVTSWKRLSSPDITHRLFDESAAKTYIAQTLGPTYVAAFERCYHPAMQSDLFRLCYLFMEGGMYVDADDVCLTPDIDWLFQDTELSIQPLCYDMSSNSMVPPKTFLAHGAYDKSWIFYFNNNPIISVPRHPIIELALKRAVERLLQSSDRLPEIQDTTGPGNLTKSVFDFSSRYHGEVNSRIKILSQWENFAESRWPLTHRGDERNWRLSNRTAFDFKLSRTI